MYWRFARRENNRSDPSQWFSSGFDCSWKWLMVLFVKCSLPPSVFTLAAGWTGMIWILWLVRLCSILSTTLSFMLSVIYCVTYLFTLGSFGSQRLVVICSHTIVTILQLCKWRKKISADLRHYNFLFTMLRPRAIASTKRFSPHLFHLSSFSCSLSPSHVFFVKCISESDLGLWVHTTTKRDRPIRYCPQITHAVTVYSGFVYCWINSIVLTQAITWPTMVKYRSWKFLSQNIYDLDCITNQKKRTKNRIHWTLHASEIFLDVHAPT